MRKKKAFINASVNIISFIISFIPNLVVRRYFLQTLGSDILGLSSLYTNIIGWISIIEMGIGTTIIYSLYKPFAHENKEEINGYMKLYRKFYRIIGIIVLIIGFVISPFVKFFINGNIEENIVIVGFIMYLLNTFLSYMFTHRLCILNVAQNGYKVTIATTISKLVIATLQVVMLNLYPNFILYILIQIVINLIYYIMINVYISNQYPWLNEADGQLEKEKEKNLLKNVKAMFMHKIGELVVLSTDNIVISKFVGLTELSKYTSYNMIISAFQSIVTNGLRGITASIGNMLIEGNKLKAYDIHKKVFFINFWVVSFLTISLYNTLNQFVVIWIGKENLLDNYTFLVILINMYFASMRGSIERFQEGSGYYQQDRYAPMVEAAINLIVSIALVSKIGIVGVFIGTLVSNFTVVFWTKPYVVYKYVFNVELKEYFKMYFKYAFIAYLVLLITNKLTLGFKFEYTISAFIINVLINILTINSIYVLLFMKKDEFKYFTKTFKFSKKKQIVQQ